MHGCHRLLITLLCALSLGTVVPPAEARPDGKAGSKANSKSVAKSGAKRAAPKRPKVSYANGDSEAQRQRREEARLRQECRGRPNAGACLGYTR